MMVCERVVDEDKNKAVIRERIRFYNFGLVSRLGFHFGTTQFHPLKRGFGIVFPLFRRQRLLLLFIYIVLFLI